MEKSKTHPHAFTFILVTTFLSVMGIGLIIPVIAFIVEKYVAAGDVNAVAFNVGLLTSLYAFCQFFAAPILGALSDAVGRRPVLLFCQLGSAIGYILFGLGGSLWVLFLGRIIDGLTGGDISTLFAYIADITPPEERGKRYGIIGAVVGVGFILGPSLGGLAAHISLSAPFYFAAGITLLNMVFGFFVLPESLHHKHRADFSWHHINPFGQLKYALSKLQLRMLLIIGLFYFLPFAQMQGISSVYYKDTMHFSPSNIGMLFLLIGAFDIITQGFLSGKLIPIFGERKLLMGGFLLTAFSYFLTALLKWTPALAIVVPSTIMYALGSGFFEPAYGALISHTAEPQEQGKIQGANQSMQSLTRIIGPLLAASFYQVSWSLSYIVCAVLSIIGIIVLNSLRFQKVRH